MADLLVSDTYSSQSFSALGGYRHPESILHNPLVLVGLDKIRIERGVRIDAFCYILGGNGVTLGQRTHLASGVSIGGGGHFETGWGVGLASGVHIITGTDEPLNGLAGACIPDEFREVHRGEVVIEDFCILFTNVIVLPDNRIGRGAVVAAGSIVNRSLEPWTVYAGSPLRRIAIRDGAKIEAQAEEIRRRYGF